MKGSYAQVVEPLAQEVLTSYAKNWSYWGDPEVSIQNNNNGLEITEFTVTIKTNRGSFNHKFIRDTDPEGYFNWGQVV